MDPATLERTVTLTNEVAYAPIAKGDVLGEITLTYDGRVCAVVPLLAQYDVNASRFLTAKYQVELFFAQRIVQHDEVKSVYLMSGAYDLMVLCEARTLKELASFVHSRLSVIEGVSGTSTHFMLKTYKYAGMIFDGGRGDRRQAVMP